MAEEKALPVILSVPTGRPYPFLTFRLNRWTSLSNSQPMRLGVHIRSLWPSLSSR